MRLMAAPADRIIFVFDGKVYSDQPVVLTFLWSSWTSLQNRVGLPASPKAHPGHRCIAGLPARGATLERNRVISPGERLVPRVTRQWSDTSSGSHLLDVEQDRVELKQPPALFRTNHPSAATPEVSALCRIQVGTWSGPIQTASGASIKDLCAPGFQARPAETVVNGSTDEERASCAPSAASNPIVSLCASLEHGPSCLKSRGPWTKSPALAARMAGVNRGTRRHGRSSRSGSASHTALLYSETRVPRIMRGGTRHILLARNLGSQQGVTRQGRRNIHDQDRRSRQQVSAERPASDRRPACRVRASRDNSNAGDCK